MVMNTVDMGTVGTQSNHRQTLCWPSKPMAKRTLDVEMAGFAFPRLVENELRKQILPPPHPITIVCESVPAGRREMWPCTNQQTKKGDTHEENQ
jgi:hypothetical protein